MTMTLKRLMKRRWSWLFALIVCGILLALLMKYRLLPSADRLVFLPLGAEEGQYHFEADFTWTDFDWRKAYGGFELGDEYSFNLATFRDAAEKATYVWKDIAVGKGTEGFGQVLRRLRALPKGSLVKVFPNYDALAIRGGRAPSFPFEDELHKIGQIAARRNLVIVFSTLDNQDAVHGDIVSVLQMREDIRTRNVQ